MNNSAVPQAALCLGLGQILWQNPGHPYRFCCLIQHSLLELNFCFSKQCRSGITLIYIKILWKRTLQKQFSDLSPDVLWLNGEDLKVNANEDAASYRSHQLFWILLWHITYRTVFIFLDLKVFYIWKRSDLF